MDKTGIEGESSKGVGELQVSRERIWKGGLREWLESNLRIKGMTERACKPFCVSAFAGQLKVAI